MTRSASNSSVRVIAGKWRGRRIHFSAGGIRPTGDRIRETLFNWLAPYVSGAACLDMFAGSGALGIEALSRGAARALLLENHRQAAGDLRANIERLDCDGATAMCADAMTADLRGHGPFDIVFLDPPFDGPALADLCTLLVSSDCLAAEAWIYMEMDGRAAVPELPSGWRIEREQTAGKVRYALVRALAKAG